AAGVSRISGRRHARPGAAGANLGRAPGGVFPGDERVDRNIDEARVAVVGLAVCEHELYRFDQGMQVFWRVVSHRAQVVALEQAQELRESRPLAPGSAGVDLQAVAFDAQRFFLGDAKRSEVFFGQPTAVGAVVVGDRLADVAAVESVARSGEGLRAPLWRRRSFL